MTPFPTMLITGASGGLGAAAARIAAGLGAAVAVNARSGAAVRALAAEIEAAGGQALAVPGDVSDPGDCARIVTETAARFGRIDALVNNAGLLEPLARIAEADPARWAQLMAVNVHGPFLMTQAALPHLRAANGRVVNISSGAAERAVAGWSAYCTSKAALNHFTRVLAVEEPGITAVSLRPGRVDTPMQATLREKGADAMQSEQYADYVAAQTDGRMVLPEAPGRAIAALALRAPAAWSGAFLSWDEDRVQQLVEAL